MDMSFTAGWFQLWKQCKTASQLQLQTTDYYVSVGVDVDVDVDVVAVEVLVLELVVELVLDSRSLLDVPGWKVHKIEAQTAPATLRCIALDASVHSI